MPITPDLRGLHLLLVEDEYLLALGLAEAATDLGAASPSGVPAENASIEAIGGQPWVARRVSGSAATKPYRCPGCDQEIPPGTAHLVAWPAHTSGPADRRHWHNPCWQRRLQRHTRGGRGGR